MPPSAPPPRTRVRLGELLLRAGVITDVQLNAALSEQRKWGGRLGRTLVEMGFVNEEIMAKALARQLNLPMVDLRKDPLPPNVAALLPVDLCEKYGVFPIGGDAQKKVVLVATSDPTNYDALDELAFRTGCKVETHIAPPTDIDRAIRKHYYGDVSNPHFTANPGDFGARVEESFDVEQLTGAGQIPSIPKGPDITHEIAALAERVARLEAALSGEVRALRGLVELLLEKGVVDREAYVAKVRGGEGPPKA